VRLHTVSLWITSRYGASLPPRRPGRGGSAGALGAGIR